VRKETYEEGDEEPHHEALKDTSGAYLSHRYYVFRGENGGWLSRHMHSMGIGHSQVTSGGGHATEQGAGGGTAQRMSSRQRRWCDRSWNRLPIISSNSTLFSSIGAGKSHRNEVWAVVRDDLFEWKNRALEPGGSPVLCLEPPIAERRMLTKAALADASAT